MMLLLLKKIRLELLIAIGLYVDILVQSDTNSPQYFWKKPISW